MLNVNQLTALSEANAVNSVLISGTSGGFIIIINDKEIKAKRGHKRIFKKLQTAAFFLNNKGIGKFTVDLSDWKPEGATQ
ncbi:MAG: hypothetical protein Q9M50_06625 [Methylococcales bacterium]|nr:hypothetical protein [Methylococcales bacterium]